MKARRRSSFSYPNQAPLIPYRTTDIEIDRDEIRPLDTGRSEPTRTSTTTLQNFSFHSPELPSESAIATAASSELRANPFCQPTRQQRQDFVFVQQHFRSPQAGSPHCSFWSESSRESISSTQITPRSSLTLSTQNISLEGNASQNTYSQIETSTISDNTPIASTSFEPEIRLPENYQGARGPITPAIHNQNPSTRRRIREQTQRFFTRLYIIYNRASTIRTNKFKR